MAPKRKSHGPTRIFQPNEVVWAKVSGHGWWPANVYTPEAAEAQGIKIPKGKVAVRFFATNECATVSHDMMILYQEGRAKYEVPSEKGKRNGFHEAIIEAHELEFGFDNVDPEIRQRFEFVPLPERSTAYEEKARTPSANKTPKARKASKEPAQVTLLEEKPLVGFVAGTSKGGRERKPKVIQEIAPVSHKRPASGTPNESSAKKSRVVPLEQTLTASEESTKDGSHNFLCGTCGKLFVDSEALRQHAITHATLLSPHVMTKAVKASSKECSSSPAKLKLKTPRKQTKPHKVPAPPSPKSAAALDDVAVLSAEKAESLTGSKSSSAAPLTLELLSENERHTGAETSYETKMPITPVDSTKRVRKPKKLVYNPDVDKPQHQSKPLSTATTTTKAASSSEKKAVEEEEKAAKTKQKQIEIERSLALLKKAREQKQKHQKMKGLGAAPRAGGVSVSSEQRKSAIVHKVVEKGDKVPIGQSTFDEATTDAPATVATKLKLQPRQHSPALSSKVPKLKLHIGAKASGKHLKQRQQSTKSKRAEATPTERTKANLQTSVKQSKEERSSSHGVVDESMPSIRRSRIEYVNSLTESKGRYWMRKDVRNAYRKKAGTRASSPPKLLDHTAINAAAEMRMASRAHMRLGDQLLKRAMQPSVHLDGRSGSYNRAPSSTLGGVLDLAVDTLVSQLHPLFTAATCRQNDAEQRMPSVISNAALDNLWQSAQCHMPMFTS